MQRFLKQFEEVRWANDLLRSFDLLIAPPPNVGDSFLWIAVCCRRSSIAPGNEVFGVHHHLFAAEHERLLDNAKPWTNFCDLHAGLFEYLAYDGFLVCLASFDPASGSHPIGENIWLQAGIVRRWILLILLDEQDLTVCI